MRVASAPESLEKLLVVMQRDCASTTSRMAVNRRFACSFDLTSDGWHFSALHGRTSLQRCSRG
jgi:hypothetical protein